MTTQDRVTRAGVSAAEKRAQLEVDGEEWPTCGCHNAAMHWHKTRRYLAGGRFACAVRENEVHKSPEYKAKNTARQRKKYATDSDFRDKKRQYKANNILEVSAGGLRWYYRVDPDKREEIKSRIAAFREHQARTRKELADNGWID